MTRQLQFRAYGDPADVLRLCEAPVPQPGPGQVLVRLTARPINPSDLLTVRGQYGNMPHAATLPVPAVPGLEGMGVIAALGPGVRDWKVGARVVPLTRDGTWQSHVVVDQERLVAVPDGVADGNACQLLVNPFTAWLLLFEELGARHGDVVVQTAAASAVGKAVIQLAARHGITLVNIVRRREGAAALEALGARHIIATEEPGWAAQVAALKPRLALDAVSGPLGAKLAATLGDGARLVVYGVLSMQPLIVDPRRLIFQDLHVRGFWLSRWLAGRPREAVHAVAGPLLGMMADGGLAMPVAGYYDLADYAAAIAAAATKGRDGKIILTG